MGVGWGHDKCFVVKGDGGGEGTHIRMTDRSFARGHKHEDD